MAPKKKHLPFTSSDKSKQVEIPKRVGIVGDNESSMKVQRNGSRQQCRFAKILEELMKSRELTIREVARLAGVGPSTVMSWKSGAHPSNFAAIRRLAHALGLEFCFLLTGESDPLLGKTDFSVIDALEDRGVVFDGYARVLIQRLEPRTGSISANNSVGKGGKRS